MKQRNVERTLLGVSLGGFAVGALSFLLMIPTGLQALSILAGALFWLGLLVGIIPQLILSGRRKEWLRSMHCREKENRCGMLRFCRNRIATVCDIALFISAAGFALSLWMTKNSGIICYFFLCFAVFFLETHCIFNGRNYNYIITVSKENKTNRSTQTDSRRKSNDKK